MAPSSTGGGGGGGRHTSLTASWSLLCVSSQSTSCRTLATADGRSSLGDCSPFRVVGVCRLKGSVATGRGAMGGIREDSWKLGFTS